MRITSLKARQILDSRGNPTVEVEARVGKLIARASAPSGASIGINEAVELRDRKKAFGGRGVLKAVNNVNTFIARKLKGENSFNQERIDQLLIDLDATPNKSNLGANAMVATSMAVCKVGALAKKLPLYRHIQNISHTKRIFLPIPSFNILNGGAHAGNDLAFQEFMVYPRKAKSFAQALQMGSEIHYALKKILLKKYGKQATNIGDEGGFAPPIKKVGTALTLIEQAIQNAGYKSKVSINIDVAASQFYKGKHYKIDGKSLSTKSFLAFQQAMAKRFNISSIEDPFYEEDFESFTALRKAVRCQIVGDDLTVTSARRIVQAITKKSCSALLVKLNQIGTVTEAIDALHLAQNAGWNVMVSHRSGETNDDFIADFAVGTGAGQIKAGAPTRGERLAKYNRLLRIEEEKLPYGC